MNDRTSSENYWIRISNNRFGRSRGWNWISVWKFNRSYSPKSIITTSIIQLRNIRICFGRSNRFILFNDSFFTFVLSLVILTIIMNIKLSYKEVKFNVYNNKVMFTIPLGTSICLEKLVQFFLDNEY